MKNIEPNEIKLTFGEEIIRINPTGFKYRGELVKDAGECHRLLWDFLRRTCQPEVHVENANERYFVGSDGIACMVTKEFFTSFHISSSEFYKTCGAPWSDEAEYYRIMLELINCSVEITFREWCGFKRKCTAVDNGGVGR